LVKWGSEPSATLPGPGTPPLILKGDLNLCYLVEAYNKYPYKRKFFLKGGFFNRLAGSDKLKKQIEAGLSIDEIRKSWENGLRQFREIRAKYLLYP